MNKIGFVMRIGSQPKGPKPKPFRAPRPPHLLDWAGRWLAIVLVFGALAVMIWGGGE